MTDKTVWEVIPPDDGKTNVNIGAHHGDIHDERLTLTGDFSSIYHKLARAEEICDQLNGGRIDASELFRTKSSLVKLLDSYIGKYKAAEVFDNKMIHVLNALKLEIIGSMTPDKEQE